MRTLFLSFLTFLFPVTLAAKHLPQLTLVIVVDQLGTNLLRTMEPFIDKGIKKLLERGIRYNNAFHEHMAETAPGHATISTGAEPKNHGWISNDWRDYSGNEIICDVDPSHPVILPDGSLSKTDGKSAASLMADTVADQIMLHGTAPEHFSVFSLSIKSRAAIAMGGRKAQTFWFDVNTGIFTSSTAYCTKLPDWVSRFNEQSGLLTLNSFTWNSVYPKDDYHYDLPGVDRTLGTALDEVVLDTEHTIDRSQKEAFDFFAKTPEANRLLLDLTYNCIAQHLPQDARHHLIVFLSISGIDKMGHLVGPERREMIDLMYHIDQQIGDFLEKIEKLIDEREVLIMFTSDHGVCPIFEQLREDGIDFAHRINKQALLEKLNARLKEKFQLKKFVRDIQDTDVYLDEKVFRAADQQTQREIIQEIKDIFRTTPGIYDIWTAEELMNIPTASHDPRTFLKNSWYPGRSGQMIVLPHPYCHIDHYKNGTTHSAPYTYNTHVPLVLYQKGRFENRHIFKQVATSQIAPTLATLLDVPLPSLAYAPTLPGITHSLFVQKNDDAKPERRRSKSKSRTKNGD